MLILLKNQQTTKISRGTLGPLPEDHCLLMNLYGMEIRPRGYKTFSMFNSAEHIILFILLINVKVPTIVGTLTFISMINTISERFKARNFFICRYFSFYEQLKLRAQLS